MAVAMLVGLAPGAQSSPVRSGTIAGGLHTTAPSHNCGLIPDCVAWLQSGCSPALAGRDPAWLTSIEDVSDLAGGLQRAFKFRGEAFSTVFIEFWTGDCGEMRSIRRGSSVAWDSGWTQDPHGGWGTSLSIPAGAKWMTIVANAGAATKWTLT